MKVRRFLVPQVEEAVARVVGVESHLGTCWSLATLDTHLEWSFATNAELELALGAGEVHAAALSQGISELTIGTLDPVFSQVLFNSFRLIIGIIGFFPDCKVFTADSLVGSLPLHEK